MNSYELSRKFFDYCFDNPEKVKPNHIALYFFAIEHCNRLGWKEKFGLPTEMTKSAIGIHSYNTYTNTLKDLIDWGFIILVKKSVNQYSSNIIALSNFNKAHNNPLDKAIIKHDTKQSESTGESIDSIDKQITIKPKTIEPIEERKLKFANTLKPFLNTYGNEMLRAFYKYWTEPNKSNTKFKMELQKTWSVERRLETWAKNDKQFNKNNATDKITQHRNAAEDAISILTGNKVR
jgi:hypothetical protein